MNPRDRLLTTLRGGVADRVPINLEGFHFRDGEELDKQPDPGRREIGVRVYDHQCSSVGCNSFVNRYMVTPPHKWRTVKETNEKGDVTSVAELDTPKGKLTSITAQNPRTYTVWTVKYPVESIEDIEKIRSVEWERPPGLRPPDASKLPPDFHERFVMRAGVSSPFVCVAGMMSYQYFLELCATHFDLMKELTRVCLGRILDALDVILADRNVEYLWMGGCEWVTPPMGSPRMYEELVQEFETPIIARAHAAGALCHVHCHGKVRSTLEQVIARGADFFEPVEPPPDGDVAFAEAKALAAGRITLGGNVEARIIENEDEAAVERAARAAFEGGKRRMVFQTTAGPIGVMTPRAVRNYHRLIDVWEEMGAI